MLLMERLLEKFIWKNILFQKRNPFKKGFLKIILQTLFRLFVYNCELFLYIFSCLFTFFVSLFTFDSCLFTFRQLFVYTWTAICLPLSSYLFTFLTAVCLQFVAVYSFLPIFSFGVYSKNETLNKFSNPSVKDPFSSLAEIEK